MTILENIAGNSDASYLSVKFSVLTASYQYNRESKCCCSDENSVQMDVSE